MKTEDKSPMESGCKQSTPAKLASTPARLMIATLTLQPQKTCYMSPDEVSSSLSNKSVRRPLRTRSLKFEEEKIVDDTHKMGGSPVDNDDNGVLSILPNSLLHSRISIGYLLASLTEIWLVKISRIVATLLLSIYMSLLYGLYVPNWEFMLQASVCPLMSPKFLNSRLFSR
ncbi:hypothetical protein GQ457_05G001870 [Hibiscus cannabinus]